MIYNLFESKKIFGGTMKFSLKQSILLIAIVGIMFCFNTLEARTQRLRGRAQTSYRSARIELQQGSYDRALELFLSVLENEPNHVESIKNVADLYFMKAEEADDEEALDLFELAHGYYVRTINTILGIADWESYTGFELFKSDSELKLASIFARSFIQGQEFYQEEDYENAIEVFNDLRRLFPDRIEPVQMLAAIANNQGDVDLALSYFLEIHEADPTNTQIINNLAVEYERLNDYDTSLKYFQMLVELEPTNIVAYVSTAYVFMQMENYEEALRFYELAMDVEPDNVDIIADAANIAIETGNDEKTISYLKRLYYLESNEDNVSFLVYQLARLQSWEDLITYSKIWHEMNPDAKEPIQFIIAAAYQLGDQDTVREYQQKL